MAHPAISKVHKRVALRILPQSGAEYPIELDYRLLVLGNFSGVSPEAYRESLKDREIRVIGSKQDFRKVLESINPRLEIVVPDRLSAEPGSTLPVKLDFKDMKDFHPDTIVEKVGPMKKSFHVRENLSAQMDEILHHPKFQALESAWRGLHFLVQNTEFAYPVKIEVLDTTMDELYKDFDRANLGGEDDYESGLLHHVYYSASAKAGEHPYTAMITDFRFDNSKKSINLLRSIATLGEVAKLPFIGNASPQFFGAESFDHVMADRYLEENISNDAKYRAWRAFRDDDRF
jgi:type VI secretion system ImpB/VipA family protein